MGTAWKYLVDKYEAAKIGGDPIVDKWFLMPSPGPVLLIVTCYAAFVLKIGPSFMKNREPFQLTNWIILYNAIQVLISAYIVSPIFGTENFLDFFYGFGCAKFPEAENNRLKSDLNYYSWVYFIAKVTDLIDTCFFVLRKKYNQITFLHVYHHIGVVFLAWSFLKFNAAHEALVVGVLNSAVHVVMYFYYLVAALGPKYRKYLWWKKYLTWLQLIQFIYIFFHVTVGIFVSCQWNNIVLYSIMINSVIHTGLFINFYQKTYKKKEVYEVNNNNIKKD